MSAWARVVLAAARGQMVSFARAPVTTIFALVLPLNLLLLMSLFALTGYNAPTALVMGEDTPRARAFVQALARCPQLLRAAAGWSVTPPSTWSAAAGWSRSSRFQTDSTRQSPRGTRQRCSSRSTTSTWTWPRMYAGRYRPRRRFSPSASSCPGCGCGPQLINLLPKDTGYVEYLGRERGGTGRGHRGGGARWHGCRARVGDRRRTHAPGRAHRRGAAC